ncbi:Methyltransferase domain-containing protein [Salinimicrobium catena]|uniref:Methyltransferase domain-containing protein n=1 Tax=Salinimicrobium catena TaxID=390640 RepID=A0A1H5NB63_9FLAO|nr:class I SAM-dependent methyltransferase [Salinimicrobium catena]SDL41741.1 Methyltransferase domain-containing protein [Salinimicrobium catena]SEE98813.1 Methyltransferase domain-containing protein [Salinimicrobium catena]
MKNNQEKNKDHYEKLYANYDIKNILYWINHLDEFLDSATTTETSWFALYQGNFREKLKGKKVLEMGCGNCINAAVMAALGAEVYANDIAFSSREIVKRLNENFNFRYPIVFVEGDFLKNDLPSASFDFVVGKAFLHHLTLPVERQFLKETARLLKPDGEARFFEPAVNSMLLDKIRWHVPVGKRPSKFDKKAFRKWKEADPHPERSLSSRHFETVGKEIFQDVKVLPVGTLERFSKIFKWGEKRNRFKKWALEKEIDFPDFINRPFTRSQLIAYRRPLDNLKS